MLDDKDETDEASSPQEGLRLDGLRETMIAMLKEKWRIPLIIRF